MQQYLAGWVQALYTHGQSTVSKCTGRDCSQWWPGFKARVGDCSRCEVFHARDPSKGPASPGGEYRVTYRSLLCMHVLQLLLDQVSTTFLHRLVTRSWSCYWTMTRTWLTCTSPEEQQQRKGDTIFTRPQGSQLLSKVCSAATFPMLTILTNSLGLVMRCCM